MTEAEGKDGASQVVQSGRGSVLALTSATSFALDLLRAAAAQLVLLGHAFDFFNVFSFLGQPEPPPQIQRMAVVVFFLLSGLLIARSAARPGAALRTFLRDRWRRIAGGLLPALVLIAVLDALPFSLFEFDYPGGANGVRVWVGNLLHLQGYPPLDLPVFGSGEPLWTLSIEWWLYVFWGGLVFLVRRSDRLLAGICLAFAFPMVLHNVLGGPGEGLAGTWFLGVLAWCAVRRPGVVGGFSAPVAGVAAASFLALALARVYGLTAVDGAKAFDRGFASLLAVSFFFLIVCCQNVEWQPPDTARRVVRVLAGYSYTLYLTHFTVLTLFYELRGRVDDRALLVLAVIVCNPIAWLVSMVGERRTSSRRRLEPA